MKAQVLFMRITVTIVSSDVRFIPDQEKRTLSEPNLDNKVQLSAMIPWKVRGKIRDPQPLAASDLHGGNCMKEKSLGILGSILRKREPVIDYRTIDGGHPAPYPDMTDEQLYNYEITFNIPHRTFDTPPRSSIKAEPSLQAKRNGKAHDVPPASPSDIQSSPAVHKKESNPASSPLDWNKPVRLVTSKHPVEIITVRARHPIYKVHGYIGHDDVVTVFTLDGQLSENGPRFLENVPESRQLYLNIYLNTGIAEASSADRFRITQHGSRQDADLCAVAGRLACVAVEFDQTVMPG